MGNKIHIGQGWDSHRLQSGDGLMLCGVKVEGDYEAVGHSDADAALHALIDALLGAAGLDDIGQHFPPEDSRWKDSSSRDLLRRVVDLIEEAGWEVVNADLTIILEAVKLKVYRQRMKDKLEQLLPGRPLVNVKFKTAEKMGPVGKNKAVEALCVVLIKN